jgi:hypothetical protein
MPPPGDDPEISILDARLAEIDRRLHSIQTGLVEEPPPAELPPRVAVPGDRLGPPAPVTALPAADARAAAQLITWLRELTAAQEGVLASMRQLLGTVQRVTVASAGHEETRGTVSPLAVSAGPFASTPALGSFRAALEALPGVRSVELRGFEGGDRAVLEVQL